MDWSEAYWEYREEVALGYLRERKEEDPEPYLKFIHRLEANKKLSDFYDNYGWSDFEDWLYEEYQYIPFKGLEEQIIEEFLKKKG